MQNKIEGMENRRKTVDILSRVRAQKLRLNRFERFENRRSAFLQAFAGVVPMTKKYAINAQRLGHFVIVHGVADEQDFFRFRLKRGQAFAASFDLSLPHHQRPARLHYAIGAILHAR